MSIGAYYGGNAPQTTFRSTALYVDLVRRADTDHSNTMSKTELTAFITKLNNQKTLVTDALDTFGSMYGSGLTQQLNSVKQQVDLYLQVANRANENFLKFARPVSSDTDNEVSLMDVIAVANKDAVTGDVSDQDLGSQGSGSGQVSDAPLERALYAKFLSLADTDFNNPSVQGDGKVSKAEIQTLLNKFTSIITQVNNATALPAQYKTQILDYFQIQVKIGQRLHNNFNALDKANTAGTLDGFIVPGEPQFASTRDGNAADLSNADLLIA
jgi:hypothetical protein